MSGPDLSARIGNVEVGDGIEARRGGFRFDQQCADRFDEHVRRSVPLYEELQVMAADVAEFFAVDGSRIYDLGCATGRTLRTIGDRNSLARCRLYGVDASHEMVEQARVRIPEARFEVSDVRAAQIDPCCFVTMMWALQFVPPLDRPALLTRVRTALGRGGALFLVEKVVPEHAENVERITQLYHDLKEARGFTPEQIRRKDLSLRGVLRPLRASETEALLLDVGFRRLEVLVHFLSFRAWLAEA